MKPILRWQRDQISKELLLLQGHISDPTCPCKTDGEKCVRKHLLTIEALAQETIPIEDSDARAEELAQLANEARELRDAEEKNLCGQKPGYKWPIDSWSRNWRKKFETLACELDGKGAKMHQEVACETHQEARMELCPACIAALADKPRKAPRPVCTPEQAKDRKACVAACRATAGCRLPRKAPIHHEPVEPVPAAAEAGG